MIDITDALAGIVSDFESTLGQLRDEADAARGEIPPERQAPAPIAFGEHYDPSEEFGPPRIVKPADELRLPLQIQLTESGMEEDDVYRWQRWTR
ncbi:hypothetical protein FZI91_03355 [Mycobacterium sp. CBMA271]|uniref:hypothetical protein n=1 Tax=unclassified Mycobacteroides TaxID=2618759 RepID=UPI0012DCE5AD|nr:MULTISPECIES: hypothetical protein [unclassified Mycobacteroides]MUM18157.1 hypothetical protein [Mycobacteroides sp. CBMA 326]MUM20743.1 hypothetical protein [Mycobacteroides sp. CBMA 271]